MPQGQDRPEADVRHVEGQNDSAWAPGLGSRIPSRLNNRITLFAAENSRISHDEAREAATFCGLEIIRLIDLTAERMVVHELLVRVTADLSVLTGRVMNILACRCAAWLKRCTASIWHRRWRP